MEMAVVTTPFTNDFMWKRTRRLKQNREQTKESAKHIDGWLFRSLPSYHWCINVWYCGVSVILFIVHSDPADSSPTPFPGSPAPHHSHRNLLVMSGLGETSWSEDWRGIWTRSLTSREWTVPQDFMLTDHDITQCQHMRHLDAWGSIL